MSDFHYGDGPDPVCDRCGGDVFFFKEGWSCGCGASGDWPAPTEDPAPSQEEK